MESSVEPIQPVQPPGYPVTFSVDYPDRQLNRLTTFFRIFTVIPIYIVLALVVGYYYGTGEYASYAGAGIGLLTLPTVLMLLFRCVRSLAIAVRPVVPASIDRLLDQLGVAGDARDYADLDDAGWFERLVASGFTVAQPVGVFPRLELPAEEQA